MKMKFNRPTVVAFRSFANLTTAMSLGVGEKYVIQEVSNNRDWLYLTGQLGYTTLSKDEKTRMKLSSHNITPVKDKQILLIDVYTKWTGPCVAVESYLRRIRHAFVEAPDSLVLARACCDNIDELEAFKHDIRPTFLFWARGRPVALMRGANRPLLTKLIHQEVNMEINQETRSINSEVDLYSDKVIQCGGDLAELDDDAIVKSIGMGNTERLSSLNGLRQMPKEQEEESAVNLKVPKNEDKKKQNGKSRKGSKKSNPKKSSKGNAFSQKENPDNIENGESDMENRQSPLGKRNQTGFNQKVRIENPAGKGEDSDEDEQHDFYNNFDESDSEEDDEENENLSQDSSWVDINGSGSEISGISYATNSGNGSEISNNRNTLNDNEERNTGNEDQNANTKCKNDNEAEDYSGLAEGSECEKDLLDNIREENEREQEVSDDDIRPVLVGSLLGAVISKSEEANKMKTAPFGRKKFKKKKKMETGLLKEILDFKPLGGRRHFSYH